MKSTSLSIGILFALAIGSISTAVLTEKAVALNGHRAGGAAIGSPAPEWTLTDTKGDSHSLKEYAGKIVVLEWTNHQCPYVQKQYRTGNMQATQKYATSHGAIWLSVISSGKGREGYVTPDEGLKISNLQHSNATAKLLDLDGKVGHEYGAKSTPDMFIVDKDGTLVYSGAIDDQPTTDDEDIKVAHNYVKAALSDLFAGKSVAVSTSQPYGCPVKYARS